MLRIVDIGQEADIVAATDIAVSEIFNTEASVCGFDTEKTVPNALTQNDIVSQRETGISRTTPAIAQLCIKGNIAKHPYISITTLELPSGEDYTCYIFPLIRYTLEKDIVAPKSIKQLLNRDTLVKVGADIKGDVMNIEKAYTISILAWLDLQDLAKSLGIKDASLNSLSITYANAQKLPSGYGNYNGKLNTVQIQYAGYDAYLSLKVYESILARSHIIVPAVQAPVLNIKITLDQYYDMMKFINTKTTIRLSKTPSDMQIFVDTFKNSYSNFKTEKRNNEIVAITKAFLDMAVKKRDLVYKDGIYEFPDKEVPTVVRELIMNNIDTISVNGVPKQVFIGNMAKLLTFKLKLDKPTIYNLLNNVLASLVNERMIILEDDMYYPPK